MRLEGKRVWVTRPESQGLFLAKALEEQGAKTFVLPLVQIIVNEQTPKLQQLILDLDLFQHIIVTSQSAAYYGLQWIDQYWPQLPFGPHWWAIGSSTAKVLQNEGINAKYPQGRQDSESLLEQKALSELKGQKILLIKGQGGRQLLPQVLETRGATVDQLSVYSRHFPSYSPSWLQAKLLALGINTFVVTSGEILLKLLNYLQPIQMKMTLVVPSERIANMAIDVGFSAVIISRGASDKSIVEALDG